MNWGIFRAIGTALGICISCTGCSFLPGFGLFESPTLYYIDVAEVGNRVACEVQSFVAEHLKDPAYKKNKWVLSTSEDVKVVLTLQTDEQGYVNFTGINPSQLGFSSLAAFITATTSGSAQIPTLAAKLTGKRTKTAVVTFSVSPVPLANDVVTDPNGVLVAKHCQGFATDNPVTGLYLRDWLNNYFETINVRENAHYINASLTDSILHTLRPLRPPPSMPSQMKIQSVELSSTILLTADVSAGATPSLFGNGSAFIVPISGLGLDYNPDYSHKIDLTLNICDQSSDDSCNRPNSLKDPSPSQFYLMWKQCKVFGLINPLISGVKPPKDVQIDGAHLRCNKAGQYRSVKNEKPGAPMQDTNSSLIE